MTENQFLSPGIAELVPYTPGEQPKLANLVKLNTNENPYPPSPRVVQAITDAAQSGLQLYPDPDASALRQAVAAQHGIAPEQVFVGNGSDEVLAHAFYAFFRQRAPLAMPDISYSFYKVYCALYGIAPRQVPLDPALRVRVADYAARHIGACGGVVVANPNAPTGIALPLTAIEELLRLQPQCVVLVDEAYVDFGGDSAIPLIARHPNLLVVHTLSKSRSLAGLRVGYACAQRPLIDALNRVKNSFNSYPLGRLAIAGAVAAFEDREVFERDCQAVMQTRARLAGELQALGFEVLPSAANFVFVRHPAHDAGTLAAGLRQHGVLVRHFRQPRIEQFLRISIGTPQDCDALVAALHALLAPH